MATRFGASAITEFCARWDCRVASTNFGCAPSMITPIDLSYVAVIPSTWPSANGNLPHGWSESETHFTMANQITLKGRSIQGQTVVRRAWTGTIFVAGSPERTDHGVLAKLEPLDPSHVTHESSLAEVGPTAFSLRQKHAYQQPSVPLLPARERHFFGRVPAPERVGRTPLVRMLRGRGTRRQIVRVWPCCRRAAGRSVRRVSSVGRW